MTRPGMTALMSIVLTAACDHQVKPASPRNQPEMDRVPGGSAVVGCTPDEPACPDFNPRRTVSVTPFWIDRFEVTEAQFGECIGAGVCTGIADRSEFPVFVETIEAARTYCAWKGKRLPTSTEWEVAARGSDARPFPWGSAAPDCVRAVHSLCARTTDHMIASIVSEVGRHPTGAGPYGTQDLAGNATEWTECGGAGGATCEGIRRSVPHAGVEQLRTYAGYIVEVDALVFPDTAGFRCARDDRKGPERQGSERR